MSDEQATAAEGPAPTEKTTTRRSQTRASSNGSGAKTISFFAQAKGGCGKTVAARVTAESLKARGLSVTCIDADPSNASFAAIAALGAEHVRVVVGGKVDVAAMHALTERLYSEDSCFVVDTGAATYLPLMAYFVDADVLDLLVESGKRVLIHMPVTGGRTLAHTVGAVEMAVAELSPRVEIVPWFNPYFGELVAQDGSALESTVVYADMAYRLSGPIRLPDLHPDYAGASFGAMLDANRTFAEERERVGVIQRMFLDRTWKTINDQIGGVV